VHLFPRRKQGEWDCPPAKGRSPVLISRDSISALFCHPQGEAARTLGVSLTTLKQVCRKLGVPRWPYMRVSKQRLLVLRESGTDNHQLGDLADSTMSESDDASCCSKAQTEEDCASDYAEVESICTPADPPPCQDADARGSPGRPCQDDDVSHDDNVSHDDLAWLVCGYTHTNSQDTTHIQPAAAWWRHGEEYPAHPRWRHGEEYPAHPRPQGPYDMGHCHDFCKTHAPDLPWFQVW
jgi:hypothetical protein